MFCINVSCGNDSVALTQFLHEKYPEDTKVCVYCNTGMESDTWPQRVDRFRQWCESLGIPFVELKNSEGQFQYWVQQKTIFPRLKVKWCTELLKIKPVNEYLNEIDPSKEATICVGVRRCESIKRADYPEWADVGGRDKWAPLVRHSDEERNALIERAGFEVLPHRSRECAPCIFSNREDIARMSENEIQRVERMETQLSEGRADSTFFNPNGKMGAFGIREVVDWARSPRGKYSRDQLLLERFFEKKLTCDGGYCGG